MSEKIKYILYFWKKEESVNYEQIIEEVRDMYPDALLADGYEKAIIGWCNNTGRVIYDASKMVKILMAEDGIDEIEAIEYLEFNVFGAYVGEMTPIYLQKPPL